MRFGLNTLSTLLNNFGGSKVLSSSSTHLPGVFARRNPRVPRSRSSKLRAARSAARIRQHRSTANAGANSKDRPSSTAGSGATTKNRRAKTRPLTSRKPLRRCNTTFVPQAPTHPQPPGAFIAEPSFIVPGFPQLDHRYLPPFVVQKLFFDALHEGRQAILRAEALQEEDGEEEEEEVEYACLPEQDLKKARAAHRMAEDAEYVRFLEEDLRNAEAAHRKAENETFARLLEEDMWKAQEAHRRAMEQEEERRRQAERESMERGRHEHNRRKQERRERERLEQERREREAAESSPARRLRDYEGKWAELHRNVIGREQLGFYDIPWPLFEKIRVVEDITEERVLAFVCHLLQEQIQVPSGGQAKNLRSEFLRWHPDKFDVKVLDKVVEGDRGAVREAAGHVVRILTKFSEKVR